MTLIEQITSHIKEINSRSLTKCTRLKFTPEAWNKYTKEVQDLTGLTLDGVNPILNVPVIVEESRNHHSGYKEITYVSEETISV